MIQIKKYEDYYKHNFDIDKIKQDICTNKIDMNLVDLFRFRIFLDSCVMLFNKEKLEKDYLKDTFDPKNYIASIKNKYGETIKEIEDRFKITVDDTFYYEFNESELKYKPKSLWDSRKNFKKFICTYAVRMFYELWRERPNSILFCIQ